MRVGKKAGVISLMVAMALVGSACSKDKKDTGGTTSGKDGGVFRLGVAEPTAIDPYNSQESEGILVTKAIYEGLVTLDNKTVTLKPGVAEKWAPNADCTEWTFNLRESKFSNGEDVTAESFIRGMNRAAAKDAASDVAYHMAGIAGYDDVNSGKDDQMSGLTAPDPHTLKVKLSAADCEFDKKTLQPVMSPVPSTAGDAKNKTFNDMPIGNGPFKLKEPWQHDKSLTLVRNDSYYGAKPHLDEVDITITTVDDEYKNLRAGTFDYARIPPTLLPQAEAQFKPKGAFIKEVTYGINYLLVNVKNAPLNSADARKAVSYAIDRDKVISGVFKGYQTKATSIIPTRFEGYYQADVCDACTFDAAKAKEYAAKAGLKPGTTVNFEFNSGAGHDAWVQAVADQIKQTLGLNVKISSFPFKELLEHEKKPNASGLFRAAWGADYPTPDNFLYPLLSTAALPPGDNRGLYSNKAFDDLLTQERAAKTDAERAPIIKQAEKLAIGDDQALIPLWYRTQYRVFNSDKFTGVELDFFEDPTLATISLK